MKRLCKACLLPLGLSAGIAFSATPDAELLASWVALDAPTGHEYHASSALQATLPGWQVDRSGNLSKTLGEGNETILVACQLDAPSMTISQIRDDGYLRLHAIGRAPAHPLWAQAHEGQQLRIITRKGPVIGVTALANGHFMNLHAGEPLTRIDDLWLDVGASSQEEVLAMGIQLLDPVLRHLPPWSFEDWIAGPAAGARIGCATVVAAAESGIRGTGKTRYVLATGTSFGGIGLSAAASSIGDLKQIILLGNGVESAVASPTHSLSSRSPLDLSRLTVINPEVENAGGLMERMHEAEAGKLANALQEALGLSARNLDWQPAPAPAPPRNADPAWLDKHQQSPETGQLAATLKALGEEYAVSGFESPVRVAIEAALPEWAAALAQTDEMGNLWIDTGPANVEATVFMAHMDEVGWITTAIHEDGTVDVKRQGGALAVAREGQPALLQLSANRGRRASADPAMLRGVFLSRQAPEARWPDQLQAWFGMDRDALIKRGFAVGMPVTGYKEAHRLAAHRFTVRGMDDRVGSTALLQVLQNLEPADLTGRVVFAWSVQEEGGLHGARALAQRLASQTRRIYSIDTFVTSDTPLESPHFAYAPLGQGPVLRSMESSGLVRPDELDRNRRVAAEAGIDVQIGMTQGGTDGTAFTFYGAPNAGLSWPGRYSHGPAELGDLRDMLELTALIRAFAMAGE